MLEGLARDVNHHPIFPPLGLVLRSRSHLLGYDDAQLIATELFQCKQPSLLYQRVCDTHRFQRRDDMASSNDPLRRKAVGFEAFAKGKKGVTRAIKEARVRKERTTRDKSILLRGYKKVMKQEGLEAGRGAGRKRGREEEQEEQKKETLDVEHSLGQEKKKRKKFDPMANRLQKLADKQKEKEAAKLEIENRKNEGVKREKERRQRTQNLKKKTRKGQPIMKNVIGDLLSKLEKEG